MEPEKPPSYSNLPPPSFEEALAADREKAKKGKCMRVSVALLSTVMVCLCLGAFVLAVIFGFWMAQCHRTGSVSTVTMSSSFSGEGTKQVTIKIDGGVSITPSPSQSAEIFSSILIASPKENPTSPQENGILVSNSSDYVIIRRNGFWRCSRFVAKVSILDPIAGGSPSATQAEAGAAETEAENPPPPSPPLSPLSLIVSSNTGDIQMREFEGRTFRRIELKSRTGIATVGGARVEGDLILKAGGEGVGLFHSDAQRIALLSEAGGISIGNTTSNSYQVIARQGNILTSTLFLSSSPNCEALFSTSIGTIQIQQLILGPSLTTPCKISISSKRGDIHLGLGNFSGRYSVQASQGGGAKVNSQVCGQGICEGRVGNGAGIQHELVVMNHNGNIAVSFS